MAWNADLSLSYSLVSGAPERSALRFVHTGPLRVLKSLYPEGPAVCHNVIVHPPGGVVSGDVLSVTVDVASGAHALISMPGATRFYKSTGDVGRQKVLLRVAEDARLEWLPLEQIAFAGCWAESQLSLHIAPGGQLMAWDVTCLGLPASDAPFDGSTRPTPQGRQPASWLQHWQWPGLWQERAWVLADDGLLLNSPLGLAGHRAWGTLVLACGTPPQRAQAEQWLDALRASWAGAADAARVGATWVNPQLLVLRCLGAASEPVMQRLQSAWQLLRREAWGMAAPPPRIWAV